MSITNIKETYTISEVSRLLGITIKEIKVELEKRTFPFPAIKLKKTYYFPKAPLDAFLRGDNHPSANIYGSKDEVGAKPKWKNREKINWNYPIPRELSDQFDRITQNQNKELMHPLHKGDYVIIAVKEFVERRPEYDHPLDKD